jgi:drug/metabolite transporter (DMT)-like permease
MAALKGKALIAYLLVCVVWGSTYLVIRIGVAELPPFLFAGLRFLGAGLLLLGGALLFGDRLPPTLRAWRDNAIVGVFLFAGGNSFVVWAEQFTPSGIASVFVVTVALWMAFFDAIVPGGKTPLGWRVVLGLAIGFLGTTLLVGASPREILAADLRGPIALTLASSAWAFGSIYYKRHPSDTSPYVAAAVQMIAGGGAVALVGLVLGEGARWHMTTTGFLSMAYLALFGSIVGFTAYVYALRNAPATIVGTYAYVNPVIAVVLGWLILNEAVTGRTWLAMVLILGAVVWIQLSDGLRRTVKPSVGRTEPSARVFPPDRPTVRPLTDQ